MRPRLREHVHFTERADGTYVHAPHGGTLLRGSRLHPWLTRLAPFLTGEHTLAELVRELPCGQRETVERLVRTLARGGYVCHAVPERAHGLTADERRVHAEQLAHLAYVTDSPQHRFQRLREARVFVCGSVSDPDSVADADSVSPSVSGSASAPGSASASGPGSGSTAALAVLREVVRLGVRAGLRTVEVAVSGGGDIAAVREVAEAALRDSSQQVRVTATGAQEAGEGDLVVWVNGGGGGDAAQPAVRGGLLYPVRLGGGEAWLGPVGGDRHADGYGPVTGTGHARLSAGYGDEPAVTGAVPEVTGAAATVVAGHAVLACERYLTGVEDDGIAVRVDLHALTTTEHAVLAPSPAPCASRASVAAWWDARGSASGDGPGSGCGPGPGGGPAGEGQLWERADALADPRTGSPREVSSGSWSQFPLWTCGAVLRSGHVVGAHGATREAARRAALLRALAADTPDPDPADPAWGWDLAASAPVRVPRTEKPAGSRPESPAGSPPVFMHETAKAAGADAVGAVADGLRAVAEQVLARRLRVWEAPLPQVHGGGRALLEATGREVRVFDASAVLGGVAAHAVTLDGVTVALRCGDVDEALEAALAAWQAERDGDAPYAPHLAGEVPERLREGPDFTHEVSEKPGSGPAREHAPIDARVEAGVEARGEAEAEAQAGPRIGPPPDPAAVALVSALAADGARPVVVPLRGEGPCVVRVVLVREHS
ncbi:hypothetical protein NMN56_003475 [Streptomyces iconiensis]|uniref:YcaO domain-containing protein n=2 Tax=Streptomyces iconiensis TaxID=1384038 RepID=A0ABT6ZPQ1_9ACTN|nr:hypothetical protein [Streptomyces iconiensis]